MFQHKYYRQFVPYARDLKASDLNKRVRKVMCAFNDSGREDWSFTGEDYVVEKIEMGPFKCHVCEKPCESLCGRCKQYAYCTKDCQRKHWISHHKSNCDSTKIQTPIQALTKIVLLQCRDKTKEVVIDILENAKDKKYLYGWVLCDDVKHIPPFQPFENSDDWWTRGPTYPLPNALDQTQRVFQTSLHSAK